MSRALLLSLGLVSGLAFAAERGGGGGNEPGAQALEIYKHGLPYTGLTVLMEKTRPEQLSAKLLQEWTTELKNSPLIAKGWVQTRGAWKKIVNNEPAKLRLKSVADSNRALADAERLPAAQVDARARIWWSVANQAPQFDDTKSALIALKRLQASKQSVYGADLVASVYGRVLYQKGDVEGAEAQFQKIPKGSNLWIEGLEEQAWGDLRKDRYDEAMGKTITLMSPALSPIVGPESYFLANLMALKVCDYTRLFKTSELFKQRHRQRLADLQLLAKDGHTERFDQAWAKFEDKGVNLDAVGPLVTSVPRQAFRDRWFVRDMELRRILLKESEVAQSEASLAMYAPAERAEADRLAKEARERARTLATNELNEYRLTLDKMHIVEGEVIERLHLDENLKGKRGDLTKADDRGDVLVFPYQKSKEVWLDELGSYKAQVKDCPTLNNAGL